MKSEAEVKKEIHVYLQSLEDDCWYFTPVPTGYGRKGIPDFVGCYKGNFFSIEAKAEDKLATLSPWQHRENTQIECAGGIAIVADSVAMVKNAFRKHLNAL